MSKTLSTAVLAALVASAVLAPTAHAQTRELDPAKRVPAPAAEHDHASPSSQPQPAVAPQAQPYSASQPAASSEEGRGGFFLGVQGGKGWVYEDVDQSALAVNAGYRWQAGAVTLVGLEVATGRLDSTVHDRWRYAKVDYASIGANARFNFGSASPVYGLVRAGYFSADDADVGTVDGGYLGLGLGVDFNRHFNMSLVYTNHVYFNELYWSDGDLYYDANRADTLMLGAEVRF